MPTEQPAKVFISYSHDSEGHLKVVRQFCEKLRADGIDAWIDQYENFPAEGWMLWMENRILETDFVLMVCTSNYLRRLGGAEGPDAGLGVRYEAHFIRQQLFQSGMINHRFIPVVPERATQDDIPPLLQSYGCYRLDNEEDYQKLILLLTGRTISPPPLGPSLKPEPLDRPDVRSNYPDLIVTQWLTLLERLVEIGQISPAEKSAVLRNILQDNYQPADTSAMVSRKIAGLSRWREEIWLDLDEGTIAEKRIVTGKAGIHQILAAIRLEADLVLSPLGIRFIFIPPGTLPDGTMNPTPFYLAEAPISQVEWQRVMPVGEAASTNGAIAMTDLSIRHIHEFLDTANRKLSATARLDFPTLAQWRFAAAQIGIVKEKKLNQPELRRNRPNNFQLHDLEGVVWQFCREGQSYALIGGSYQTCRSRICPEPPRLPCRSTVFASPEYGFRPKLILTKETRYDGE